MKKATLKGSNMKKSMLIGIYTIYPLLLLLIFRFLNNFMYYDGDGNYYANTEIILYGFLAVCYISPFCGFYYFAKKRPFNQWLLFVGFIPVPVILFIYDLVNPPTLYRYLFAGLTMNYYTLPFVIISVIFAHIITTKDNRKE